MDKLTAYDIDSYNNLATRAFAIGLITQKPQLISLENSYELNRETGAIYKGMSTIDPVNTSYYLVAFVENNWSLLKNESIEKIDNLVYSNYTKSQWEQYIFTEVLTTDNEGVLRKKMSDLGLRLYDSNLRINKLV